jgi:hypothetical protein
MVEQANAAAELLRPLRKKAKRLWLLKGTAYHEGTSHAALEQLGKELDAEIWSPGRRVGYSGYFDWHGLTFCFAHHQTSGWLYLAGGADRTALLHQAAVAQGKAEPADVIVRSHLHTKRIVFAHDMWVVQTPGWTVVYPWLEKVSEHSRALEKNDIGGIVATLTDGALSFKSYDYLPYKEEVRKA